MRAKTLSVPIGNFIVAIRTGVRPTIESGKISLLLQR